MIFSIIRLAPGDPVAIMYGPLSLGGGGGGNEMVSEQDRLQVREKLGLNKPIVIQYFDWMARLLRFDLGISFRSRQPVTEELARRFPATALLALCALCIEIALGLSLGLISAIKADTIFDHIMRIGSALFRAMPSYWLGLLLLYLFVLGLGWVSASGEVSLRQVALPALTLGLVAAPRLMRVLRASMLAEMSRLYIVFGRAKGVKERYLILGHAFRNALLPVVTLLAMSLTDLLCGSAIIETVFSWPGIGKYLIESIYIRDYPVVQAYVLLITLLVVFVNLLVDISYTMLDPCVRLEK